MAEKIRNTMRAAQMLQALGGDSGNPIDALFSFLEPILADMSGQLFEEQRFAEAVREAYGWDFTDDVADGFRRSFRLRGWLKQKRTEAGNIPVYVEGKPVEIVTYEADPSRDLAPHDLIDQQLDNIAREFRDFLKYLSIERSEVGIDDDEFIDKLVEWLLNNSSTSSIIEEADEDGEDDDRDQIKYLIARFVDHMNRTNVSVSNQLRNVAAVGLISELAQDFDKPRTRVKRCSLNVYLDSPVALDLLGASGDEAAELNRVIINKLQSIGAKVSVFASTVREMQSILDGVLLADPENRWGPSADAVKRGDIEIGFLTSIRNDPANAFAPFNIQVKRQNFERALKPSMYFTEGHYGALYDRLLDTQDEGKEKRIRHDALSASWIMRLRKGHEHPDIFESTHLFLTRNRLFTSIARQFCINSELLDDGCVGPLANMHDLAASLWLRTGLHSEVDIPKRQLLVGCQRVLAIKKPVVVGAQRAILKLRDSKEISEEKLSQIEAVLAQDRSLALIADRVRGAREILDDSDLLKIYHQVLEEEQKKGFAQGKAEGAAEAAAERAEAQDKLEKAEAGNLELSEQLKKANETIESINERERKRLRSVIRHFNDLYQKRKKQARILLLVFAAVLLALSVFKEMMSVFGPEIYQGYSNSYWPTVVLVLGVIPLVIAFADYLFRIFGSERPIDKFVLNPWGRSRLTSMLEAAGFEMTDAIRSSEAPSVPLKRIADEDTSAEPD